MKKIIAAVDFTEASDHVIDVAVKLAKSLGGSLALVHVVSDTSALSLDYGPVEGFNNMNLQESMVIAEAMRKSSEEALEKIKAGITGLNIESFVLTGNVKDAIVEFSEDWGAEMIVVGSHNHSGFFHFLEGETSAKLVHLSHVPVLVVPELEKKEN